ncbi:hypothetical protein G7046_g7827 [Stylonectria norvegica]|nr:hypothetical protein G7046_g7827 [Stylonectria norvegica]
MHLPSIGFAPAAPGPSFCFEHGRDEGAAARRSRGLAGSRTQVPVPKGPGHEVPDALRRGIVAGHQRLMPHDQTRAASGIEVLYLTPSTDSGGYNGEGPVGAKAGRINPPTLTPAGLIRNETNETPQETQQQRTKLQADWIA